MKKLNFLLLIILLSSLQSCWWRTGGDDPPVDSVVYEPVIVSRADLENISLQTPIPTTKNAKIYVKDQFIFVNDQRKGFHIIDNSNPSSPQKINFLNALGSTDVAIRNNVFYMNQARDLVAFQINTSTNQIQVLKRIENVFPELASPNGYIENVTDDKVVIDWKLKN